MLVTCLQYEINTDTEMAFNSHGSDWYNSMLLSTDKGTKTRLYGIINTMNVNEYVTKEARESAA